MTHGAAEGWDRVFGALADFTARRAGSIVLLTAVLAAAGGGAIPSLRLHPDVTALFPEDSPRAADFTLYREVFSARDTLFLMAEGADAERLMDAADALKERLDASGRFRFVRGGLDAGDESFYRHYALGYALWLIPPERWNEAKERLDPERMADIVARRRAEMFAPGGVSARFMDNDPLGLAEFLPFVATDVMEGMDVSVREGYFFSSDGKCLLLAALPRGDALKSESAQDVTEVILRAQEEVSRDVSGIVFHNTGGAFFAVEDEASIKGDILRTAAWSLPLILALLLFVFGGAGIFILAAPTAAVALLATAGVAALYPGRFTILTAGFAAVMAGLGVDYVIHFYNVFRSALSKESLEGSIRRALLDAGPGVAGGAATTALAFSVLATSGEPAVAELGFLLAAGTLAFLVSTLVFMPALVLVLTRTWPRLFAFEKRATLLGSALSGLLRSAVGVATGRPRTTLALTAALTAALGFFAADMRLDDDLRALRSIHSRAAENERLLRETFGGGGETLVVFTSGATPEEALERIARPAETLRKRADAAVRTDAPDAWIPTSVRLAERRAQIAALPLEDMRSALAAALEREGFNPEAFRFSLLDGTALDAPPSVAAFLDAAPADLRERYFAEKDGTFYAAMTLRVPSGIAPESLEASLAAAESRTGGHLHAASLTLLVRDFSRSVRNEAAGALAFVTAAVLLLTLWWTRSWRLSLLALLPAGCGLVWTLGAMEIIGTPLNLVSAAFLPMLLGIGLDDGLHVVFRRLRNPGESVTENVLLPGRGILLTSLTTIAGFGALLVAESRGLVGIGVLGVVGMAACFAASVVVLPAVLALTENPSRSLRQFLLGSVFWRKFHRWAVRNIVAFEPAVVWVFTAAFFVALPAVRRAVDANLTRVLGSAGGWERRRRVFRVMHNFATCATDTMRMLETGERIVCEVEGREHFDACLARGGGIVVLTAHMGSWESAPQVLLEHSAMRVHIVRAREADPATQAYEQARRHAVSDRVSVHYVDAPDYMGFGLLKALKGGDAVALQGDRTWPGTRAAEKIFFGNPAKFPAGPVALAALAGVPILPVFSYRTGPRRSCLVIEKPVMVEGREEEAMLRAMDEIVACLERAVRRDPFQWFCFEAFWK